VSAIYRIGFSGIEHGSACLKLCCLMVSCRHGLSRKSQAGPGPPPPRVLEHEEAGRGPPVCPVGPRPPDEPELSSPHSIHAPRASPEVSDIDPLSSPRSKHVGSGGGLLRVPSFNGGWEAEVQKLVYFAFFIDFLLINIDETKSAKKSS